LLTAAALLALLQLTSAAAPCPSLPSVEGFAVVATCTAVPDGLEIEVVVRRLGKQRGAPRIAVLEIAVNGTVDALAAPTRWTASSTASEAGGARVVFSSNRKQGLRVGKEQGGFRVRLKGANVGLECFYQLTFGDGANAGAGCASMGAGS
jgi:hypothetical protein